MECRRTVITSGVLQSPPSASAAPLAMAANIRARGLRNSRLYDCDDEVIDEYNNNNNSNVIATTINNTTQLVDELEQLRTDNFQLRLRVYNAERRVDKLSAAALRRDREKRCNSTNTDSDDSDDSSDHKTAAAKKTAEAAVRTIHDLLTVNRRLLALLAATVSAKAVSVSADDKRRWRRLRKHIEKYTTDDLKEEKTNELDDDDDDEFHDESATDSESSCKAQVVSYAERSATRQNILRSPPPPTMPSLSAPLETTGEDDEGAGSEVSRLRGRCRRLERSLQQLVNTELWARNRQIGKLEQQRYVTQVADAAVQRDRKPAETVAADTAAPPQHYLQQFRSEVASANTPLPVTKGILVKRLPAETPTATASTTATESLQNHRKTPPTTVATITTPPPVLPDYSEVNFFFSCDEEEEEDEDSAEMNTSSPEEETADSNDCGGGDEEPVRLAAIGAPVSSTSARKRHCRPHQRQPQQSNCKNVGDTATVVLVTTTDVSSSTESASTADEADDLNGGGVIPIARSRTVSGGSGLHRRRRCRPPRRCSTCGRCSGVADAVVQATDHSKPAPLTDAQVQCGDGSVAVDPNCSSSDGVGEQQLQLLRRELDARRRENGRLYDILLRLQRGTRSGDRGKGDGGPRIPSPDLSADSDLIGSPDLSADSDLSGSPESYQRAAGAVHGRIADLLPPLLSMRSISDDGGDDDDGGGAEGHRRDQPDGAEQQQQQQLMLLTRLRERIVAYERRELNGGDDRAAAGMAQPRPEDTSNDAVRRMDRADLLNVALPRVVERLRQALVPLLQQRSENAVAAASGKSTNVGGGDSAIDGAPPSPPTEGR